MRRSPKFAIVTAVVAILAMLGATVQLLHPFLPPAVPVNSYADRGDFLQQANPQQIPWQPLTDDAFVEAQGSHRPVLLLTGAEWSEEARAADHLSFSDSDIQALISSDYVPVRVDCDENPEWLNAYFPISRFTVGLNRGNQTYFLSPNGGMYDYVPAGSFSEHVDNVLVSQQLLQSRDLMKSAGPALASQVQRKDINELMSIHPQAWPTFGTEEKAIEAAVDPHFQGLPSDDLQVLVPQAYKFCLLGNAKSLIAQTFYKTLLSPLRDWIDGGFFRACGKDWKSIQFDKLAVANAEMMSDSALYGARYHDDFAEQTAKETFDSLLSFRTDRGLLGSCRIGDEQPDGRSLHCSFSAKDFRSFWNSGLLPEKDRTWAVENLNLNVGTNPQLVPWISNVSVFEAERARLRSVLGDFRTAKATKRPRYGSIGYADVNGYTAARMIECARLWNDPIRLSTALTQKNTLELLRQGPNVDHWLRQHHGGPELTDYLAYSDASLQDFLATGNTRSLNDGLQVLLEAKRIFELSTPGAWLMAKSSPEGLPKDYLTPQVADDIYESCTAREIRLMTAYSRLLAGNPDTAAISTELLHDARSAVYQFEPAANVLGVHAAGYYCAAYQVTQPYAVAVGVNAVALANDLYRLSPLSFVAPALGTARQDLQKRGPGIYVIRSGSISGPFLDPVHAAALLKT